MLIKTIFLLFLTFAIAISLFFFIFNKPTEVAIQKDFVLVKIRSDNSYPFALPIKNNESIGDILSQFGVSFHDSLDKIYKLSNRKWVEVSKDFKIIVDATFKIA